MGRPCSRIGVPAAVLGGFTGGPQPGNIAAARLFLSNRAPSLNPAGKPVLPNVAEDTLNPAGTVNVAPFSFFNVLGDDPPLVSSDAPPLADIPCDKIGRAHV